MLRVLGRFLIYQRYPLIPLVSLLCAFAVRLSLNSAVRLSLLRWYLLVHSKPWWFTTGCELQILRATMWLQVEEVATTEIYWLKACALHFQTSVGYPAFSMSQSETHLFFPIAKYAWYAICWCQVRINCHMVLSKFQPFDHPLADVLDQKVLRMLGYVIARKIKNRVPFLESRRGEV